MDARIQFYLSFCSQVLAAHRILMNRLLIFTMRRNQARRLTEEAHQHLVFVHQHVARAAAHEQLDAAHRFRVGLHDFSKVVIGGPKIERVVGQRLLSRQVKLLLQKVLRRGLRHRVGHIHERGHAPGNGGTAFGVDVSLVRHSRLTEMHMLIDDARNQILSGAVNHGGGAGIKVFALTDNLGNLAIRNKNTCREGLSLVDKCRIFNIIVHQTFFGLILPVIPRQRRLRTPKTASLKMPLLIFD